MKDRLDPRSPLVLDTVELGRRAGSMRKVRRTAGAPADLGTEVIGVPAGSELELDLRLEAVMEGVLVSGTVTGSATGECVRCLEPVGQDVRVDVQELFVYADKARSRDEHDPASGENDEHELDGDLIDVEPVLRDAVVLALPFQPVCRDDCPGLCPVCGIRLGDEPDDGAQHRHDDVDPRWATLRALVPGTPGQEES